MLEFHPIIQSSSSTKYTWKDRNHLTFIQSSNHPSFIKETKQCLSFIQSSNHSFLRLRYRKKRTFWLSSNHPPYIKETKKCLSFIQSFYHPVQTTYIYKEFIWASINHSTSNHRIIQSLNPFRVFWDVQKRPGTSWNVHGVAIIFSQNLNFELKFFLVNALMQKKGLHGF